MSQPPEGLLSAKHVMEYPYRRSLGPVLSAFFTGLRERTILGARTRDGRVLVPPAEYDPETGEATGDLVEVGPAGTVTSWAWVHEPRGVHPVERPFAFALVRLDGADTALLHAVVVDDKAGMRTGMRVEPRWRDETEGRIQDIECFVPEAGGA